jgi:hypothetical protein
MKILTRNLKTQAFAKKSGETQSLARETPLALPLTAGIS